MKQLTLEISERQEQEELSEALQQLQRVTLGEEMRYSLMWEILTGHPNLAWILMIAWGLGFGDWKLRD